MFDTLTGWIASGGLPAIAALMFLENLFPPIPSELIMPLAGYTAAQGAFPVWAAILAGTLGSVAGGTVWYAAARAIGRDRFLRLVDRFGLWLTLTREETEGAMAWFLRHGRWAVFLGRMVPTIRTLISIPAGLVAMPIWPFLAWSTLGSLIWTAGLALAGVILDSQYERVGQWLDPATKIIVAAVVLLYLYRLARGLMARRA